MTPIHVQESGHASKSVAVSYQGRRVLTLAGRRRRVDGGRSLRESGNSEESREEEHYELGVAESIGVSE